MQPKNQARKCSFPHPRETVSPTVITTSASPTDQPTPTTKTTKGNNNNLSQAAIEISCFLSNNNPGTPGTDQILQKYGVTMQQVSDYHQKAYQKTLPAAEQSAFDNAISSCRH